MKLASFDVVWGRRVEFDAFAVDVRWLFRLRELFVWRGTLCGTLCEEINLVWRGWFYVCWRQIAWLEKDGSLVYDEGSRIPLVPREFVWLGKYREPGKERQWWKRRHRRKSDARRAALPPDPPGIGPGGMAALPDRRHAEGPEPVRHGRH